MKLSTELIAALAEFEKRCPMKCEIVGSSAEFDAAIKRYEADGLRLACVSNAGLEPPRQRLTFLPADAFTDAAPSRT